MTRDDVRLMVAGTKQTKDWTGKTSWTVPNGLCTNSFDRAVKEWCKFFSV